MADTQLTRDEWRRIIGMEPAEPERPERTFGGTMQDIGVTLGNAAIGAGESVVGLGNLATFGGLGKVMNAAGYDPKAARQFLSQYYSDAQKAANREVDEAKGFWDTTGAMLRNPSTLAATVVESAPSMFIGGGVGGKLLGAATGRLAKAAEAGSKSAAKYFEKNAAGQLLRDRAGQLMMNEAGRKALGRTASAIGEGAVAGGALAEQMRQEDPDKEFRAKHALYGALGGLGTGLLSRFGSGVAGRMGIQDVDTLLTTGLRGAAQGGQRLTAGQIAKSLPAGMLTEGVFEELPQSMQEQVWQNLGTGQPWDKDVLKSGAQGMLAGVVMGGGVNARASLPGAQQQVLDAEAAREREVRDAHSRLLFQRPQDVERQLAMNAQAWERRNQEAFREAEERHSVGVIGKALDAGGFGQTANRAPDLMESLMAQQQTEVDLTPAQREAERLAVERAANPEETDAERMAREDLELMRARNSPWGKSVAQAEAALDRARQTGTPEGIRSAEENLRMVVELSRPSWETEEERLRRLDALTAEGLRQEQQWAEQTPQRLVESLRGELDRRTEQRKKAEEEYAKAHKLEYTGDTTVPARSLVRGDKVQVRDAQGRPDVATVRGSTDDGRVVLQDGVRMTFGENDMVPIQGISLNEHAGRQQQGWGFKSRAEREALRMQRAQRRAVDAIFREEQRQQRQEEAARAAQAEQRRIEANPLPTSGDSALEAQGASRTPSQVLAEQTGAANAARQQADTLMNQALQSPMAGAVKAARKELNQLRKKSANATPEQIQRAEEKLRRVVDNAVQARQQRLAVEQRQAEERMNQAAAAHNQREAEYAAEQVRQLQGQRAALTQVLTNAAQRNAGGLTNVLSGLAQQRRDNAIPLGMPPVTAGNSLLAQGRNTSRGRRTEDKLSLQEQQEEGRRMMAELARGRQEQEARERAEREAQAEAEKAKRRERAPQVQRLVNALAGRLGFKKAEERAREAENEAADALDQAAYDRRVQRETAEGKRLERNSRGDFLYVSPEGPIPDELWVMLAPYENQLAEGQRGERYFTENEAGDDVHITGQKSSYPAWFRKKSPWAKAYDQRFPIMRSSTADQILHAINKVRQGNGDQLGKNQRSIWYEMQDLAFHGYQEVPGHFANTTGEYNTEGEQEAIEEGYAQDHGIQYTGDTPIPVSMLAPGDRVQLRNRAGEPDIATHKGYTKDGKVILKDGVEKHLKPTAVIDVQGIGLGRAGHQNPVAAEVSGDFGGYGFQPPAERARIQQGRVDRGKRRAQARRNKAAAAQRKQARRDLARNAFGTSNEYQGATPQENVVGNAREFLRDEQGRRWGERLRDFGGRNPLGGALSLARVRPTDERVRTLDDLVRNAQAFLEEQAAPEQSNTRPLGRDELGEAPVGATAQYAEDRPEGRVEWHYQKRQDGWWFSKNDGEWQRVPDRGQNDIERRWEEQNPEEAARTRDPERPDLTGRQQRARLLDMFPENEREEASTWGLVRLREEAPAAQQRKQDRRRTIEGMIEADINRFMDELRSNLRAVSPGGSTYILQPLKSKPAGRYRVNYIVPAGYQSVLVNKGVPLEEALEQVRKSVENEMSARRMDADFQAAMNARLDEEENDGTSAEQAETKTETTATQTDDGAKQGPAQDEDEFIQALRDTGEVVNAVGYTFRLVELKGRKGFYKVVGFRPGESEEVKVTNRGMSREDAAKAAWDASTQVESVVDPEGHERRQRRQRAKHLLQERRAARDLRAKDREIAEREAKRAAEREAKRKARGEENTEESRRRDEAADMMEVRGVDKITDGSGDITYKLTQEKDGSWTVRTSRRKHRDKGFPNWGEIWGGKAPASVLGQGQGWTRQQAVDAVLETADFKDHREEWRDKEYSRDVFEDRLRRMETAPAHTSGRGFDQYRLRRQDNGGFTLEHSWEDAGGHHKETIGGYATMDEAVAAATENVPRFATEGEDTKTTAARDGAEQERPATPAPKKEKKEKGIADKLGEHIGGSRADTAKKTGARGSRGKADERLPEWAKTAGYSIREAQEGEGFKVHFGTVRGGEVFDTYEDALDRVAELTADAFFFVALNPRDSMFKIAARNQRHGRKGHWLDAPGFDTEDEARQYLREHLPELMSKRDDAKNGRPRNPRQRGFGEADLATAEVTERVGKERRTGDAAPDDFMSAFGFRGVEFGLWNNQKERQALLNDAYDALMDLADLLGVPPRALSLNGELALAFGARGKGKARAHYEPGKVVINLTKTSGKGSLAHEWMHALDYYFGGRGERKGPISEHYRQTPPENVRPEVFEAFRNVMDAIVNNPEGGRTKYYQAAIRFRNSDYWANRRELLARAFSAYIEDTLAERGEKSDFLSYGSTNALYGEEWSNKPYPEGEERRAMNRAFADFFATLKVDDSEGRATLYSIVDEPARPDRRAEVKAAVDLVRKLVPGLTVKNTTDLMGELERRGAEWAARTQFLKNSRGLIIGAYHSPTKTVLLSQDADASTVLHEVGWHAVYDWARTNAPELYRQMQEYAKHAPKSVQDWVQERYGTFTPEGLLDEIGARMFTEQGRADFEEAVQSRAGRSWYQRLADVFRQLWNRFIGAHRADLGAYQGLAPEEAMKRLLADITAGRRLEGNRRENATSEARLQIAPDTTDTLPEAPDGSLRVGEISAERGAEMHRQPGEIRLYEGEHDPKTDKGYGIAHIEARHGKEIRQAGYNSAEHFVADVTANYNEVRRGGSGSLFLIKKNGNDKVAVIRLAPHESGDFYNVETAYLSRSTHKKELLWSAAQSHSEAPGGQPTFARASVSKSGQTTPNALPTSSAESVKGNRQAVKSEDDGTRFTFAGEQGAAALDRAEEGTHRLDNLAVARDMEAAGKDPKTVKLATGWERGKDGKWRYEIDDSGSSIWRTGLLGDSVNLGGLLDAPELFKAYPQLRSILVKYDGRLPYNTDGGYSEKDNVIVLNKRLQSDPERLRSILHHEIQHAIQAIEGFARGGDENQFQKYELNSERLRAKANKARRSGKNARADKLEMLADEIDENGLNGNVEIDGVMYEDAFDAYRHLAGETEGRNVERRLGMTAEERRASLASETEDVAREDQIVLQKMMGTAASAEAQETSPPGPLSMNGEGETRQEAGAAAADEARRDNGRPARRKDESVPEYNRRYQAWRNQQREKEVISLFQAAYHGSPFRFSKFTLDKIGTGEGSQVHGWGLYFALERKVSEEYADRTRERAAILLDGRRAIQEYNPYRDWYWVWEDGGKIAENSPEETALNMLIDDMGVARSVAEALRSVDRRIEWYDKAFAENKQVGTDFYQSLLAARKLLENNKLQVEKDGGFQVYRVDIPEDHEMLREDAPLAEQSAQVRQSLEWLIDLHADELQDADALRAAVRGERRLLGRELLKKLQKALGSPKAASIALNEAGIKGIRYNGGRDGECAVVWDDTAVEILETYYQAQQDGKNPLEALKKLYGQKRAEAAEQATSQTEQAQGVFPHRNPGESMRDYKERRERWAEGRKEQLWNQVKEQIRSILPDKAQANAIIGIIEARAKSAGISAAEFVHRRGLEFRQGRTPGDPLAQGEKLQGAFSLRAYRDEGRAVISAFEAANVSTLAHELAHMFRQDLERFGNSELLKAAEKWAGVKDGKWTREQEEKFARAFEKYLREGKAPTNELKGVFARFRDWLTNIYRRLKGSPLDVRLSPEITRVFDALLTENAALDRRDALGMGAAQSSGVLNQTGQEERQRRIETEQKELGDAYDKVLNSPLVGTQDEVLAYIGREDIEEAFNVTRGPVAERDGEIIVWGKRLVKATGSKGYGLVKVVYKHGEGHNDSSDMPPVTRRDVLALPELVRDYAPAEQKPARTTWRIPRPDGNLLVIASGKETEDDTETHLITMFVGKRLKGKGAQTQPVSQKRKPVDPGLPDDRNNLPGDTGRAIFNFIPDSRNNEASGNSIEQTGQESNLDPDTLYQTAANPAANNTVTGQSFVDRILDHADPKWRDRWERFIYNFLDTNDPRERVWKKAGAPTDQDFVTVERLRGKKAAAEQKKFREEMVTPMLQTLGKGGLAVSDLEEYAHAMHTPERNQKMREVNAKRNLDALRRHMPKAEAQNLQDQIDFVRTVGKANGWTLSDIQNAYLGMMENVFQDIPRREALAAQAEANLTPTSSKNARAHVEKLKRDLAETKAIRDRWRRESIRFAGQTDQEAQATIQKWQRDSRFAALQRAHKQLEDITAATLDVLHEAGYLSDEEFQEIKNGYQHYVPLHRDGFLDTTPIKLMQVAKGSMRDVVHIVSNVVRSHETAVNRKHRAAAGKALYEFAEAFPDAGISIEEMEMKPTHDQEGNIVMYRSQAEPEDGIFVRVNGKQYLLRFAASNKTPEGRTLLRFLESVKGSDAQLGGMTKALHEVTKLLAMVNTSLSPEFMVTNFARDLQTAFIHLNQKDIDMDGLKTAVAHDIFPAMKGIWAAERGDKSSSMAKWYADFQANGGKVGWMQGYEEAEKLTEDLQEEMKLYQDGHRTLKARKKLMKLVESGNAAIENCMRLATYKNLVERGISKDKAARIASGLTVDFTQHGKMGPQINALYMFWNASVQGSVRMVQALASSKKVRAIAGGIAGAGFVLQMLALAGGGDDDSGEPYILGIPDAIRERNIIIMLPGGKGKYIKIPKAYGYGAIYDFGAELANSIYMGAQGRKYDHTKGAMRVVNSFANSFNPIQSATMLQTLAPTLLDPVAYVAENRTWAGTPLMPEQNPYGPPKPDAERSWKGTSPIFKKLSKTLNEMTGGDAYQGGWADISPETFSMVWDNATGGMGRFIGNTLALPFSIATGDTEAHKVPFARQVFGTWNDRAISTRYYEAMDRAEIAHMRFKNAENLADRKRLYQTPDHKLYLKTRQTEKQIRALRKRQQAMEAAGNRDGAERIRTRIVAAQSKVLAAM